MSRFELFLAIAAVLIGAYVAYRFGHRHGSTPANTGDAAKDPAVPTARKASAKPAVPPPIASGAKTPPPRAHTPPIIDLTEQAAPPHDRPSADAPQPPPAPLKPRAAPPPAMATAKKPLPPQDQSGA